MSSGHQGGCKEALGEKSWKGDSTPNASASQRLLYPFQGSVFRAIVLVVPWYCVPYSFRTKRAVSHYWTCRGPKKYMVSYLFNLISNVSALLSSTPGCFWQCLKICPYLLTNQEPILLLCLSGAWLPGQVLRQTRRCHFGSLVDED